MRSADFQRALGVKPCARTEHFALHHVVPCAEAIGDKLSTAPVGNVKSAVDETRRLGLVVPKRMARRAVTRNLVKRQGRAAFADARGRLAQGDWLIRLRKGFDLRVFASAGSDGLRRAVGAEVHELFLAACRSSARRAPTPSVGPQP